MAPLLDVRNISVRYGKTVAVDGLSLQVARDEVVALIGPNGAGKSTTLKTLAGELQPAAGEIVFAGCDTAGEPPERLVRRGLALVPENRQIFASLTVEENLRLSTFVGRSEDPQAEIERELNRFPLLRPLFRRHAGGLSGGEQQMLAISRALLCNPDLLMLDEPSLGLAPRMVATVFEALRELRASAVPILLVEQNAYQAMEFADRTYVLSGGRIAFSGTSEELVADARIESTYLGGGL